MKYLNIHTNPHIQILVFRVLWQHSDSVWPPDLRTPSMQRNDAHTRRQSLLILSVRADVTTYMLRTAHAHAFDHGQNNAGTWLSHCACVEHTYDANRLFASAKRNSTIFSPIFRDRKKTKCTYRQRYRGRRAVANIAYIYQCAVGEVMFVFLLLARMQSLMLACSWLRLQHTIRGANSSNDMILIRRLEVY